MGRVLGNEEEVVELLRRGTMINLHVVDFAKMSFLEQIKVSQKTVYMNLSLRLNRLCYFFLLQLVRQTNVLIGLHGAGLMLIMFAAEEAVLVEVHPSYRQDRHFRHAARMTGKSYMALRARQRESCHGTSDNIIVPLDEFQATVDGAVRLARTFDGGLVECGLVCPPEILAMDPRLNPHYKPGEKRSAPIDTSFPCG